MYSPIADYSEWIEFLNPGPFELQLLDWRFSKEDTLDYIILSDSSKCAGTRFFFCHCKRFIFF